MSVGDIKGSRRRIKQLKAQGHFPRTTSLSFVASLQWEKDKARRMAAAATKKK